MFTVDRIEGGDPVVTDVTSPQTQFAVDFGSLEAGYVAFTSQGPVRIMRPYIEGQAMPLPPGDKDADGKALYRPGFYVKVAGNALGGVREWISNASALLNALDELYQKFIQAPEAAMGKVPVVAIVSTVAVKSGSGAKSSTNYAPVFQINTWVDRPALFGDRTVPPPALRNGHAGYTPAAPAPVAPPVAAVAPGPQQAAPPAPPVEHQTLAASRAAVMPF